MTGAQRCRTLGGSRRRAGGGEGGGAGLGPKVAHRARGAAAGAEDGVGGGGEAELLADAEQLAHLVRVQRAARRRGGVVLSGGEEEVAQPRARLGRGAGLGEEVAAYGTRRGRVEDGAVDGGGALGRGVGAVRGGELPER